MPWRKELSLWGRPPTAAQVTALAAVTVLMEVAEAQAASGMWCGMCAGALVITFFIKLVLSLDILHH